MSWTVPTTVASSALSLSPPSWVRARGRACPASSFRAVRRAETSHSPAAIATPRCPVTSGCAAASLAA
eukprot:11703242-Alexandrium_andersonii.AAC.1